ncbi:MAG TPA: hypothetical protein PJ991_03470 [Kiritimatiellia bacterium]|nr:hypothetical protein [Kiritimatiellia bacterium]
MNKPNNTNGKTGIIEPATDYKGRSISFYHPNGKGTGSALRLEPRINRDDDDRYNCFFLEMAPQKTMATREDGKTLPATFDWSAKITVKLTFLDIAEILTVLEGKSDKAGGDRNGIFHATGGMNTLITFQRNTEQRKYYLGLSCKRNTSDAPRKINMIINEVEATGLRCLLQAGLFFITFPSMLRGYHMTATKLNATPPQASGQKVAA